MSTIEVKSTIKKSKKPKKLVVKVENIPKPKLIKIEPTSIIEPITRKQLTMRNFKPFEFFNFEDLYSNKKKNLAKKLILWKNYNEFKIVKRKITAVPDIHTYKVYNEIKEKNKGWKPSIAHDLAVTFMLSYLRGTMMTRNDPDYKFFKKAVDKDHQGIGKSFIKGFLKCISSGVLHYILKIYQ